MKIAVFYELDSGGARRATNEFSRAMKKLGHTVDLFYVDANAIQKQDEACYSCVCFYKFIPIAWSGGDWKSRLRRDTFELYDLWKLHKKIAQDIALNTYDFAFIHPSKFTQAPFILRHLHIPKIYYCQEPLRLVYDPLFTIPKNVDLFRQTYERIIRNIRKRIDGRNIQSADVVLANSRYTKHNILQAYGLQSTVCHMGVDTSRFYPDAKKSIDLLFIGTRDEEEGYPLFQESLSLMKIKPTIKYLIRGENWATSDSDLRKLYSQARIVICFAFHEPFGLIPLEAMACGSVVIALNEGGYKDSVKNGKTGVLVSKNPKEIAKTLDQLLASKARLRVMSRSAERDMKENWQWSSGAMQILKCKI